MYVLEQLGRRLVSFKQNPFALPTFSVLSLFFLPGKAEVMLLYLSFPVPCSFSFKDSSHLPARRCFSGDDLKFLSI